MLGATMPVKRTDTHTISGRATWPGVATLPERLAWIRDILIDEGVMVGQSDDPEEQMMLIQRALKRQRKIFFNGA